MSNEKPKSLVKIPTALSKKKSNLSLDNEGFKPSKLRSELYEDLRKDEKVVADEDSFNFSHPVVRGIGFVIDSAFTYLLVRISLLIAPIEFKVFGIFLDHYKLKFILSDERLIQALIGLNIFLALFFFIVLQVTFFNTSIGKKITGQRVRGREKYTLSFSQVFKRELIYKPLGVVLLVGLVMPFFDKFRQSAHDKMSNTFVVKDS